MAYKLTYWAATAVMFLLMGLSIIGYTTDYETFAGYFIAFGFPTWMVYPLAFLKLLALVAIATNRYRNLKDIAYGAYFINMAAATTAHVMAGDNPVHAYVGLVAVPISYILSNKVRGEPKRDAFLAA